MNLGQVLLWLGPILKHCLERQIIIAAPRLKISAALSWTREEAQSPLRRAGWPLRGHGQPAVVAGPARSGRRARGSNPQGEPRLQGAETPTADRRGPDKAALLGREGESERGSDLLNLFKCKSYNKFFKERKAEGRENGETAEST